MLDTLTEYRHSGRMGSASFVVPLVGLVVGFVLAVVYAYADVYIPIAGYVSFILTCGFAFGVGYAVSVAAVKANCRSVGYMRFMGVGIGLLALYFSWVAFTFVLLQRDMGDELNINLGALLMNPSAVWRFAAAINETGWYELSGGAIKGVFLWVLWGIEALIVVGGVMYMAPSGISGLVFCERCSRWCQAGKDFMRLMIPQDEAVLNRVTEGTVDALADMPVAPLDVSPYLRIDVDRCNSCADTATWRAALITHERTKEGKLEEKTHPMVGTQLLTPEGLLRLDELAAREPVEIPDEPEGGATDQGADSAAEAGEASAVDS